MHGAIVIQSENSYGALMFFFSFQNIMVNC